MTAERIVNLVMNKLHEDPEIGNCLEKMDNDKYKSIIADLVLSTRAEIQCNPIHIRHEVSTVIGEDL